MIDDYVRSGIAIINNKTSNLKNLDELGIYLSKQNDANALKTLKLIILANENNNINKKNNKIKVSYIISLPLFCFLQQ